MTRRRIRISTHFDMAPPMRRNLLATLAAWFASLAAFTHCVAHPATPTHMASTQALFFSSGIQRRLEVAIRANDAAAVRQLLSEGARVDARGVHEATPLMIAVDAQAEQAVAALLSAGANPNLKAADGAGAVHLAVRNHATAPQGHAILEMIMRAGGDPDTIRPDGDPVIVQFTYDHDLDGIRWFKSLGANLDIRGRSGRPIISDLAFGQNWDSVWALIELGARYDYEGSLDALGGALDSSYASSPDAQLYPCKRKVWQLFKDHGIAVKPWREARPPARP